MADGQPIIGYREERYGIPARSLKPPQAAAPSSYNQRRNPTMLHSLAYGASTTEWERRHQHRRRPLVAAAAGPGGGRSGSGVMVSVGLHPPAAAVMHHSGRGLLLRQRPRQRWQQQQPQFSEPAPVLLALKQPSGRRGVDGQEQEAKAGQPTAAYPSSFLSRASSIPPAAATAVATGQRRPVGSPRILALSAAGVSAEKTAKQIVAQLEKSVQQVGFKLQQLYARVVYLFIFVYIHQTPTPVTTRTPNRQARRAFRPKRPYLADMKDPLHHFRVPDLITCVLRALLQASLLWWLVSMSICMRMRNGLFGDGQTDGWSLVPIHRPI